MPATPITHTADCETCDDHIELVDCKDPYWVHTTIPTPIKPHGAEPMPGSVRKVGA